MIQSVPRAIAHHLTTNWPILWAARLDVPLVSGLLLLVLEIPIFLLGRRAEQQVWGVGEPGDWKMNVSTVRGLMWMVVLSIALGAVILWLISMRRVYVRDTSPRMVEHPSFIDIVLGTLMIVTPVVAFGFAVPRLTDTGPLSDVGSLFQSFLNPTLILASAEYSSILATFLTSIMRSSIKMVLLSIVVCFAIAVLAEVAVSAAFSLLFPGIDDSTVKNVLFTSFIVWLTWTSYGATRIQMRERLLSITFPSLVLFVGNIQSLISTLIASTGVEWGSKLKGTFVSGEPLAMLLFVVILIALGEVLSRQWARLSQMPK
jgi:hypothetical protein